MPKGISNVLLNFVICEEGKKSSVDLLCEETTRCADHHGVLAIKLQVHCNSSKLVGVLSPVNRRAENKLQSIS